MGNLSTKMATLNRRIVIQKPTITATVNGVDEIVWKDYVEIWASATNLYGGEYYEAAKVNAQTTVKFLVRYNSDINTDMRISFRGKFYNITFIDNLKYDDFFMEIRAIEIE